MFEAARVHRSRDGRDRGDSDALRRPASSVDQNDRDRSSADAFESSR